MLIGLIGKMGSGKSAIVKEFVSKGAVEYNFADPLKKIGEIFGFSKREMYGSQLDKSKINPDWNISGRHFLQVMGSAVCRDSIVKYLPEMLNSNKTIWVRLFEMFYAKWISDPINKNKILIVGDVRFLDEADSIKQLKGILIRVHRYNNTCSNINIYNKIDVEHISEKELENIKYDMVIFNNYDIKYLEQKITSMLKIINKKRGL